MRSHEEETGNVTQTVTWGKAGATSISGHPAGLRSLCNYHAGNPLSILGTSHKDTPLSRALKLRCTIQRSLGCGKKYPQGGETARMCGYDMVSWPPPGSLDPRHPVACDSGRFWTAPVQKARRELQNRYQRSLFQSLLRSEGGGRGGAASQSSSLYFSH